MNDYIKIFLFLTLISCQNKPSKSKLIAPISVDFTISFGSCDDQNIPNMMWDEILKNKPDIYIWGGDIVYSDTDDMDLMKEHYATQKNEDVYQNFIQKVPVMGTWDDHDYGLNDGGVEFKKKDQAQQILLDFLDADSTDIRRSQKGIYYSQEFTLKRGSIKIIVLDSRYFRTQLTEDPTGVKNYIPNSDDKGTILGEQQWIWLENELKNSTSNYNIIVSSIQFISRNHGFESWGNMPHEIDKMEQVIAHSKAGGVIFLSGDRHFAEISKNRIDSMEFPLIDFTSSGLTHSYDTFTSEKNEYRIGDVVSKMNFGILKIDLKNNRVLMEIRGENNQLFQSYIQNY